MNVVNGDFKCLQKKLGNLFGIITILILAISINLL